LAPFNPQISPNTYYAAPGTGLTFTGTGFAPGEVVNIALNNSSIASTTVDTKGGFTSNPITIPFGTQSANFTFTSSATNINQSINIGIAALNPGIQLDTYYNVGGAPLTVTGMGFGGNEKVDLVFDSTALGNVSTDVNGNFTFKTVVPFGSSGNHTITATGQSSKASSSATFSQSQVYTNVQLKSYAGAPGVSVTFIGSGFLPGEPINITTDRTGSTVVYTFDADSKGSFIDSGYIVPVSFTGGPLNITVTGAHSMSATVITYFVTGP
jgi:hypothetical protein